MAENDVRMTVRGDCGHQFEISLVGHDPHTMEITCPVCGAVDRFEPEQAAAIMEHYEAAKKAALARFRGDVDKMLRDVTRGSKVLKYRPKR